MLANTNLKRYNLGIIASRSLDRPELLDDLLSDKLANIGHVYSNGANPLVEAFCKEHGLTYTVSPTSAHAFASTSNVLAQSEFVYIITDGESKVAKFAQEECIKKGIKHKVIAYSPFSHWREKIGQIKEIIDAVPVEEIEESSALKAIRRLVK